MSEAKDQNQADGRRGFLARCATLGIGVVGATTVGAAGHEGHSGPTTVAFVMSADTEGKCGTCVFWGGKRHVSLDKAEVHAGSLGMCNNPASPNYHKITTPESGPMKAWSKWPALEV